jgi:hypothetical protein
LLEGALRGFVRRVPRAAAPPRQPRGRVPNTTTSAPRLGGVGGALLCCPPDRDLGVEVLPARVPRHLVERSAARLAFPQSGLSGDASAKRRRSAHSTQGLGASALPRLFPMSESCLSENGCGRDRSGSRSAAEHRTQPTPRAASRAGTVAAVPEGSRTRRTARPSAPVSPGCLSQRADDQTPFPAWGRA